MRNRSVARMNRAAKTGTSKDLPPLQFVRQRTGTSCGLACLAMLTNLRIGTLRALLAARLADFEDDCTDVGDMRTALSCVGIRLGRMIRTRNWAVISRRGGRALAAVRFRRLKGGYERWHWVVVDGAENPTVAWDPQHRDGRRRDLHKLPLAWYHPVKYP